MFAMDLIMLRPRLNVFIEVCGLPDQYKLKADTKITVGMCCQICDRKS